MCGIAGLWDPDGRADLGRLHRMSGLMRHRGPDDEGVVLLEPTGGFACLGGADTPREVFASGLPFAPGASRAAGGDGRFTLGLLHRRLSIVDLSPSGHQPMCDPAGRHWIVFNGEVYNFVELRHELEALGETFHGTSDTEVILAAYRRWGRECLARFNGMFALALWDGERRELFCARDRFGVKPLYYQWDGRRFAFASEPEALALTQERRVAPRLEAIRDLLALDWVDHDARTFFEGLMCLPAAHYLVVGERGLAVERWWSLKPGRAPGDGEQQTREFARLFTDAVRLRLRLRRGPGIRRARLDARDRRGEPRALARGGAGRRGFLGDVRSHRGTPGRAHGRAGALLAVEGDGAGARARTQGSARRSGR
jgi:asparagine synthase (glutamine-hydrolysing)